MVQLPAVRRERPRQRRVKLRIALAVVPLLVVALLSACGVGRGSAITIGTGDTVRVGVIPAIAFAPLFVAIEQGYFHKAGIKVETEVMQNAAAIAPSVLNGQLQFGTAATSPFIAARAKGLPLVAVAGMTENSPASNDGTVIVRGDSIQRPRDLEGKTVAINGIGALPHVAIQQAVRNDGGDPAKVTFVVMGFPEMPAALKQGRVDGVGATEPIASAMVADGARVMTRSYVDAFSAQATISLLFTAQPFVEANPELVATFRTAMERAAEDCRRDPALVARVMAKYGGVPPEAFKRIVLPPYTGQLDANGITQMSSVMKDLGYIKQPIDGKEVALP